MAEHRKGTCTCLQAAGMVHQTQVHVSLQAHEGHEGDLHEDENPTWGVTGSGLRLDEDGALELQLPPVSISVVAF